MERRSSNDILRFALEDVEETHFVFPNGGSKSISTTDVKPPSLPNVYFQQIKKNLALETEMYSAQIKSYLLK